MLIEEYIISFIYYEFFASKSSFAPVFKDLDGYTGILASSSAPRSSVMSQFSTVLPVGTSEVPKPTKKSRISYNSQLSPEQKAALQHFFSKSRYPSHTDKKELSEKHNIDPFLLNKWFQGERIRFNKEKKGTVPKRKGVAKCLKTPKAPKASQHVHSGTIECGVTKGVERMSL